MTDPIPTRPSSVREQAADGVPSLVHPGWAERFPWLVQGTTTRGDSEQPFDLGLFSDASEPALVHRNWKALREAVGFPRAVHAQQVHGAEVRFHAGGAPGLFVTMPCDGHVTATRGLLLGVTTADCVPVFFVDPRVRSVAAIHAGWRGIAAGVLERGIEAMQTHAGSRVDDLHLHLGPAICGSCYEVGPEVFTALDQEGRDAPAPIDLRAVLVDRASRAGVPTDQVSTSEHCTRCTGSNLFSHRGGSRERQVGFIGLRP